MGALQTEGVFLVDRLKQMEDIGRLFRDGHLVIADYNLVKNRIFAEINLPPELLETCLLLYETLRRPLPRADLIIRLRAEPEALMERIRRRDRGYERNLDPDYIRRLAEAYDRLFASPEIQNHGARVYTLDTTGVDLVNDPEAQRQFVLGVRECLRNLHA